MAKRRYSVEARAAYHRARVKDNKVSARKKKYSRDWLEGFNYERPMENYQAVKTQLQRGKGKMDRDVYIWLSAFRNGLKAQLDKNNRP